MYDGLKPVTYKIKEAAAYLGISEWLLRKMAQAKEIPHSRAGKLYLFRQVALDEWLNKQEEANLKSVNQQNIEYGKIRKLKA